MYDYDSQIIEISIRNNEYNNEKLHFINEWILKMYLL